MGRHSAKNENGLTDRQQKFADLILSGMPKTQAGVEAGYSPGNNKNGKKSFWKVFSGPAVRRYVEAQREKMQQTAKMDREEFVRWLVGIMRYQVPYGGTSTEYLEAEMGQYDPVTNLPVKYKTLDKLEAARLYAKVMGFDKPQPEPVAGPVDTLAELFEEIRSGREAGDAARSGGGKAVEVEVETVEVLGSGMVVETGVEVSEGEEGNGKNRTYGAHGTDMADARDGAEGAGGDVNASVSEGGCGGEVRGAGQGEVGKVSTGPVEKRPAWPPPLPERPWEEDDDDDPPGPRLALGHDMITFP